MTGPTHLGDPCIHCAAAHDEFEVGPCKGDLSKAIVTDWCSLGVRPDGVEHFRYRLSDNSVHDTHRHVSEHAPYWHFGRAAEFGNPPRYDARLAAFQAGSPS
jgi:hypothetical protein